MTPEMITAIGALVVGLASILSAVLLNRKTMALVQYRLEMVEKKLDQHNHYAARFEEIEKNIIEIKKDIEFIKNK